MQVVILRVIFALVVLITVFLAAAEAAVHPTQAGGAATPPAFTNR